MTSSRWLHLRGETDVTLSVDLSVSCRSSSRDWVPAVCSGRSRRSGQILFVQMSSGKHQLMLVLRNGAPLYKQQQHGTKIFSRADHEGVLLALVASVSGQAQSGSTHVSGASVCVQRSRGPSAATAWGKTSWNKPSLHSSLTVFEEELVSLCRSLWAVWVAVRFC